ncbi:hypothetical protein ANCCAN_29334 [Ancylostoma caninum]|uniref:WD domain, G-beta repeat protein n=1 Tax=Ancylostoma caninum TaxID=29170 RepID=A0A368F455_ANCCA|nr:hypothetical protein ANCCAN_29334 [Ancylostoma caninum]
MLIRGIPAVVAHAAQSPQVFGGAGRFISIRTLLEIFERHRRGSPHRCDCLVAWRRWNLQALQALFMPTNTHLFLHHLMLREVKKRNNSSQVSSGLRLWDTRKIAVKEEGHVLSVLEVPISKDAGVTSLCLDRFGSSLFAAVTDNCVYEYGILTSNTKPVRHFTGASIESFYVQVQASPVSDHLLCGSKNQQAVVWDLQDLHQFSDGQVSVERRNRAGLPRFTLNGHDSEVCCVSWSRTGK